VGRGGDGRTGRLQAGCGGGSAWRATRAPTPGDPQKAAAVPTPNLAPAALELPPASPRRCWPTWLSESSMISAKKHHVFMG
jgi:hypothetical protein